MQESERAGGGSGAAEIEEAGDGAGTPESGIIVIL